LESLVEEGATFLIVGAHALAVHGAPRATGDLDIWIRPDFDNAQRVWRALTQFGAPVEALGLRVEDLTNPDTVFQLGIPPRRIDILTEISGVAFEEAWEGRVERDSGTLRLPFLGRSELLRNKAASGRPKDLADLALLEDD
jgi:hypothetical protein